MRSTTATLCPASSRISASLGAWSEARTIRAPSSRQAAMASLQPPGAAEWQDRLAPSEQVARAARPTAIATSAGGSIPGQLERP